MSCTRCIYLSRDGSHLANDYLKETLAKDPRAYTCKYPHPFRSTWVFGLGLHEPGRSQMGCNGNDFKAKEEQLTLNLEP